MDLSLQFYLYEFKFCSYDNMLLKIVLCDNTVIENVKLNIRIPFFIFYFTITLEDPKYNYFQKKTENGCQTV